MKLLSRLFKNDPPAAAVQQAADGRAVPSAADASAWVEAGQAPADAARVVAAAAELPDGSTLRQLAGVAAGAPEGVPTPLLRAAQARLAALVDDGAIDLAGLERDAPDRNTVLCVIALCKDEALLSQAIASIPDLEQVARLAADSPASRVRQLAAERIAASVDDAGRLHDLVRQVRASDKSVYKILKHKIDALNSQQRAAAELAAEAAAVCASLERHAQRTPDAHYASTLEHFLGRWQALHPAAGDADLERRVRQAEARCREVIAGQQLLAAQREAERAAELAARQAREQEERASAEARAQQAAAEAEKQREADARREAEAKAAAEAQAAAEHSLRQLGGLIRKAGAALGEGNTQAAAGIKRAIEEKLATAPALPPHLARSLSQLDEKLNELRQWKDFAVAPKRAELIAEMEALIGSPEEPAALAERIKSLQQEWKTVSKGIVVDPPEDWERFHRASQAAYQPCKVHFEAQAQLRARHLEQRQALLKRVEAFESSQDWNKPDWSLLARVLREAPLEWRRHFPVEREAGRTVQKAFDAALARLQARLDAWHQDNVTAKEALIKRAQGLSALEGREAVEGVKRLQAQWKETGSAPREREQTLWHDFRAACDAVFQKRQQVHAEHLAGLESARQQALALCEEVEAAAVLSGTDLVQAVKRIPDWRSAFTALGELPRADARAVSDRFETALARLEAAWAQQRERDAAQAFTSMFDAARQVSAFGLAVARQAGEAECAALKQAAEGIIAAVAHWPKGGSQAVKEALAKAGAARAEDVDGAARARRLLCIRAEIHAEMPTPPEDEALRREYQVQRLMRNMGQGESVQDRDWEAMALEWVRSGPVPAELYDELLPRLLRCRPAPAAAPRGARPRRHA